MVEAIIEVQILRDGNLDPTGIYYNIIGFSRNIWLALFVNTINVKRFKTNNNGELNGIIDPVPSEYFTVLETLGGFTAWYRDSSVIPQIGLIVGLKTTDEFNTINIIELRYD